MSSHGDQGSIDFGGFRAQVLAATDIVELIGRTVALKRRGRNFVGLCPFHQEKTGSFNVDPTRQYFHCFGCKTGGNAIDFVMKRDRMEFIDALKLLADALGLELPRTGSSRPKSGERQTLFDIQSAAGAFYARLLSHPEMGLAARQYLTGRGFTDETISKFQLGLAPDAWDGLLKSNVGKKYSPDLLVISGLLKKRENGPGHYDTFRNRIMFPIRDDSGRVIAFGGRVMPGSDDKAKYLNSPETPLFSKSRSVFGLDAAKQKIVETRTAVVVEGYTDVVIAHQFGASNVVSPLGTALTPQHINLLRRYADKVVLLFDADAAGDTAADKAVGLFLTQEIDIAVASMPEGIDPDEYLLEHGVDGFNQMIGSAADALTFKWKSLFRRYNAAGDSLTGQQKSVEEYLKLLAEARGSGPVDSIRWGRALAQVSRLTAIPADELNRRFKSAPKPLRPRLQSSLPADEDDSVGAGQVVIPTAPAKPVRRALSGQEKAERQLLGALLIEPNRWVAVQQHVSLDDFSDPLHRRLAETYWAHQQDEGEPVFNEFLGSLSEEDLRELAVSAVQDAEKLAEHPKPELTKSEQAGAGGKDGIADKIESARLDIEKLTHLVDEAVAYFEHCRRRAEERKLIAQMQQTGDEQAGDPLKMMQERARQPDLRRF